MRKEIERQPRPDGRIPQTGEVDSIKYTVPDCSYKGYDVFTWPEGVADESNLPCKIRKDMFGEDE